MPKKLLFITGTRADFGKLEPLAIAARDAGFQVGFFVTGMHMLTRYGLTKQEVHRLEGITVYEFLNQRPNDPQDMILAKTIIGLSDFLIENRPDLVVFHGDRVEALACALVCATNYIRSAHIEGGEVSGTIDEIFRHCNSKLASHHFVSSDTAKLRVQALGEPAEHIHVIGSPELDFHAANSGVTLDDVVRHYSISSKDYGIVVFHPVTSETATMGRQAQDLFSALEETGRYFVLIAPNNDPGSDEIVKVIDALPKDRFRVIPSMRFSHFSELMKNAAVMIGNSSAGVREAPFLGIPSLDIGTRQTNRATAPSLYSAKAQDRETVLHFVSDQWGKRYFSHAGFGKGNAAKSFVQVLTESALWSDQLQKTFRSVE